VKDPVKEAEEPHVGTIVGEADDQIQMVRITRFRSIDVGRDRRRPGMRVVEPDHVDAATPGFPLRIEVIRWIDDEPRVRPLGDVVRGPGIFDEIPRPDEDAAALVRPGCLGVTNHVIDDPRPQAPHLRHPSNR
jgi:hypothetical protein